MVSKERLKELKKEANGLKPEFNLGKAGITQNLLDSIDKFLTAHKIVKIKVLIATSTDDVVFYAEEVSKETSSKLIERKGFTFTVFRD